MFATGKILSLERELAEVRATLEATARQLIREQEQVTYWREKAEALIDQLLARASARPVMETKVHPALDEMLNELPRVMTSLAMREIPGDGRDDLP